MLSTSILSAAALAERPATYWDADLGDFYDFSNWTLGSPSLSVDARIDNEGTAYIDTPGSGFQSVGYVYLGSEQESDGTLEITTGGTASFTSMIVGALNATGTLNITGGGLLTSFGGAIGSDYLGIGVATVDGTDSLWNVTGSDMTIGGNGTGTARLQNGGSLTVGGGNGRIKLGTHPVSEGNLYIGFGGNAGTLNAREIYNGEGRATVIFNHTNTALNFSTKFTGLKTVNGFLDIRHEGPGTTVLTATESNLAGTVTVAGGTLIVNGKVMGSVAEILVEEEIVQERTVGETKVLSGGTLGGNGFIEGKTTVGGTLSPGVGAGVLEFGGDLSLESTSTVLMELGGLLRDVEFDSIDVGGALLYGGTLKIAFLNGFLPADGALFDLFEGFESQSGTFDSIEFVSPGYIGEFNEETGVLAVSTVPEPSTFGLAIAAFAALGLRRGKRSA